jgi:hypothetical protein
MSTLAATNLKNASSGSNNIVLNTDGTTTITSPSNIIKSGTAVASTSGTSIDFTSIPSWVKRITVMFNGVSTNGTSSFLVRLGTSSGVVSTGYTSAGRIASTTGTNGENSTTGFVMRVDGASYTVHGTMRIVNISGNTWISDHTCGSGDALTGLVFYGGGKVGLSATLDRVRITTVNGTDTFDAGTINILYEG